MKKNVSKRGIFLVSIFFICTVAVVWRRYNTTTKNPGHIAVRDSLYQQKRVLQYNTKVYSKALRLANNGDVVMRMHTASADESNAATNDTIQYSDAGIISRENDTVFVYYATTKAGNPNGQVFREPLWRFGHPESNRKLALYRIAIDSIAIQKLLLLVQKPYNKIESGNRLREITRSITDYNSVFIAGCFRVATNDTTLFQPSSLASFHLNDIVRKAKKISSWDY